MQRIMRYLCLMTMVLFLGSCLNRRAAGDTDATAGDTVSLSRLAWEMRRDGEPIEKIIAVQANAVEQVHKGQSGDNPVEVLEQMGYLYNIAGQYATAIKYYQEATDSLKAQPLSERNDGAIQLFGDLSTLYDFLGIFEKAVEYNDSAIAESLRQGGIMLSDVYRFRAGIYLSNNDVAEASRCYNLALNAVDNGAARVDKNLLKALILSEKAYMILNAYPDDKDSVDWAVSTSEKVLEYDEFDKSDRLYTLGLGYIKQGKIDKGLPLLQKAAESYKEQGDVERIRVANTALLEIYANCGMYSSMAALVPQYIVDTDSVLDDEKAKALIGAMVKYDIKASEERNRILSLRLDIERERKLIYYGIGLAIILILSCLMVMSYQRIKVLNYRKLLQEKELRGLSESNNILNKRVDMLEKDLSAGMNSNSMILSSSQLITGKEEGRFRRAFNVLYPDFIVSLKHDFPKLTANDELLCMLLYLKHTTEEISVYLGISRTSVNSARYRLRTKFSLPKDVDLDSFIISRKG